MNRIITSSVLAALVSLSPAAVVLADFDNVVKVSNDNSAYVKNEVKVKADTGDNSADGGYGSGAGDGGSVSGSGNDDNVTGNGGNGGNGGIGGIVWTGNALAGSSVENKVNTNKTIVNLCDCKDDTKVKVSNTNHAKVKNYVYVKADTGDNSADGGDAGGSGGDAGSVSGSDNDDNKTGNGGNGGHGGGDGYITTGHATAVSDIVNRVNKNVTRIN